MLGNMYMPLEIPLGELAVAPVNPVHEELITVARFSHDEELLWTGTDSGAVYGTACPTLERYCTARTGGGRVEGLAPLRGGAVAVASRASLTVHAPGGRALAAFRPSDLTAEADYTCVAPLPGSGGHIIVAGRANAPLVTMDLSRASAGSSSSSSSSSKKSSSSSSFVSETSADAAPNGAAAIATAPRGLLAVGTPGGRVLLLDPRAGWRPVADVAAHGAAVLAADCGRDLLATAGAVVVRGGVGRGETLAADPVVRVFDVRSSAPRPLSSLHFAPRAIDLKFHPHLYGTLLLASANGVVALADVTSSTGGAALGGGRVGPLTPIDTGGVPLTCCDIAPSGGLVAAGSSGGFVHLLGRGEDPETGAPLNAFVVDPSLEPPTPPEPAGGWADPGRCLRALPSPRALGLPEEGETPLAPCGSCVALDFGLDFVPEDGGPPLSSTWGGDAREWSAPPKAVDPVLLASARRDDFIAYVPNPKARAGRSAAEAAAAAHGIRNARVRVKGAIGGGGAAAAAIGKGGVAGGVGAASASASAAAAAAAKKKKKAAAAAAAASAVASAAGNNRTRRRRRPAGSPPAIYDPRIITSPDAQTRYADFDFAAHNPTRFAGLENGIANCYANALVQALFYGSPWLAAALARSRPDARAEFSLLDECGAIFRALPAAPRGACQASNLLRALRASREAVALGLVEAHAQRSAAGGAAVGDIEAEAAKVASLARRVQSLARFLLEAMHREAVGRKGVPRLESLDGGDGGHGEGERGGRSDDGDGGSGGSNALSTTTSALAAASADSIVSDVFGIPFRSRTQLLAGDKRVAEKPGRVFSVELSYPPPKQRPVVSSLASSSSAATAAAAVAAGSASGAPVVLAAAAGAAPIPAVLSASDSSTYPIDASRPSFSDLLAGALKAEAAAHRAWFDDKAGYAFVTSSRAPTSLPAVLVVSTGLHDRGDLAWWAPYLEKRGGGGGASAAAAAAAARRERGGGAPGTRGGFSAAASTDATKEASPPSEPEPWLPAAVTVEVDSAAWDVRVRQGRSVGDLAASVDAKEAEADAGEKGATASDNAAASAAAPTRPENLLRSTYELTSVVAHLDDPDSDDEEEVEEDDDDEGNGINSDGDGSDSGGLLAPSRSVRLFSSSASRGDGEGHLVTHVRVPASYLDPSTGIFAAGAAAGKEKEKKEKEGGKGEEEAAGGGGETGDKSGKGATPTWLLINDFAIIPTDSKEPRRTYGSAKAPALLMFTRVEAGGDGEKRAATTTEAGATTPEPSLQQLLKPLPPPPPPPPVKPARLLTDAEFVALCARGGTGNVNAANAAAGSAPALVPLGLDELPRPGDLFGLDAEFVALAPALRELRPDGEIVETRPARLGLARVSVVRGGRSDDDDDGEKASAAPSSSSPSSSPSPSLLNVPAIDDYIRQNEPVFDYLTRWSGLRPADLDPSSTDSQRGAAPLATLKESYAKLAHLVASGATFVGHGLAQDFRMINIVVPPDQVVDTVHLFYLGEKKTKKEEDGEEGKEAGKEEKKPPPPTSSSSNNNKPNSRGRKLSLRFLVSRLLGNADFQSSEHDSVEDARAALALYEKWRELKRQGKLEETLEALYDYGRAHGFDPSANSSSGGGVVFGQ